MLTISNGQVKQGKVKTHLSLTIKLKKIKGHFFPSSCHSKSIRKTKYPYELFKVNIYFFSIKSLILSNQLKWMTSRYKQLR